MKRWLVKDTLILVQLHHSESEFVPQPKGCEVPNIQGAPSGKAPAEEDPFGSECSGRSRERFSRRGSARVATVSLPSRQRTQIRKVARDNATNSQFEWRLSRRNPFVYRVAQASCL